MIFERFIKSISIDYIIYLQMIRWCIFENMLNNKELYAVLELFCSHVWKQQN